MLFWILLISIFILILAFAGFAAFDYKAAAATMAAIIVVLGIVTVCIMPYDTNNDKDFNMEYKYYELILNNDLKLSSKDLDAIKDLNEKINDAKEKQEDIMTKNCRNYQSLSKYKLLDEDKAYKLYLQNK